MTLLTRTASSIRLACWSAYALKRTSFEGRTTASTSAWTSCCASLRTPNLHDIANMSFRVELWDRHALHIRWVVAAAGSVFVAHAAFDEAVKNWPDEHFTLRQGIMLIREH